MKTKYQSGQPTLDYERGLADAEHGVDAPDGESPEYYEGRDEGFASVSLRRVGLVPPPGRNAATRCWVECLLRNTGDA